MSLVHYKKYEDIALFARNLRKNLTPSEKILWEVLRRKNLFGFKFLRQHPVFYRIDKKRVEFYIADFYCSKLKLIIEVDGIIHEYQKEYDSERDAKLLSKDIQVIRIKNEALVDIKSTTNLIKSIIIQRITQITENKQNT
jgi:leucyl-tRNA synthetase